MSLCHGRTRPTGSDFSGGNGLFGHWRFFRLRCGRPTLPSLSMRGHLMLVPRTGGEVAGGRMSMTAPRWYGCEVECVTDANEPPRLAAVMWRRCDSGAGTDCRCSVIRRMRQEDGTNFVRRNAADRGYCVKSVSTHMPAATQAEARESARARTWRGVESADVYYMWKGPAKVCRSLQNGEKVRRQRADGVLVQGTTREDCGSTF